jgi:hypothetical protein
MMSSCRIWVFVVALLATASSGDLASAAQCDGEPYGLADVKDAPHFEDYPVLAESWTIQPARYWPRVTPANSA